MQTKQIIGIAILFFVVGFIIISLRKKEGFKVSKSDLPPPAFIESPADASQVPMSGEYYPSISALNGSSFRGSDFSGLVASPSLPKQKHDTVYDGDMSPQGYLPHSTMEAGSRYNEDGSVHNSGEIIGVNLAKHRLQSDCITSTFNIRDYVPSVSSVHAIYHDAEHYTPPSLITGSSYEKANHLGYQYDERQRSLEIRAV